VAGARCRRAEIDALALHRFLEVGDGDLVGEREYVHAFHRRDVEHHAAREEAADFFHAEFREAGARGDRIVLDAVVEMGPERLVRQAVELACRSGRAR